MLRSWLRCVQSHSVDQVVHGWSSRVAIHIHPLLLQAFLCAQTPIYSAGVSLHREGMNVTLVYTYVCNLSTSCKRDGLCEQNTYERSKLCHFEEHRRKIIHHNIFIIDDEDAAIGRPEKRICKLGITSILEHLVEFEGKRLLMLSLLYHCKRLGRSWCGFSCYTAVMSFWQAHFVCYSCVECLNRSNIVCSGWMASVVGS